MEFMRDCPDDAACLDMLWRERYAPDGHTADCPKCERPRRLLTAAEAERFIPFLAHAIAVGLGYTSHPSAERDAPNPRHPFPRVQPLFIDER
jgi:hypothetical protein